jgi:hypothetical protein
MVPFIIGGILIVAGALVSLIIPRKIKDRNIEIKFTQTTSTSELKGILTDNAAAGLEGYRHFVELKGLADSDIRMRGLGKRSILIFHNPV